MHNARTQGQPLTAPSTSTDAATLASAAASSNDSVRQPTRRRNQHGSRPSDFQADRFHTGLLEDTELKVQQQFRMGRSLREIQMNLKLERWQLEASIRKALPRLGGLAA